ncbi:MAG TPA: hypothetical protein VMP01_26665 [Pirellulaceae bacterium]|nr:hypothetical protein [Pirellulaceae bacterium]
MAGAIAGDGLCLPHSRRRWLAGALAAFVTSGLGFLTRRSEASEQSTTSRQAREEAKGAIPLDKLNDETQRKILSVVERPSIYRRMPEKVIPCDSGLYLFLLRNPEVVLNIWQLMGVSGMSAQRTGAYSWKGNDGAGTLCNVELAYGTSEMHLAYGEGFYEGPLFKRRISGRCVVMLRSEFRKGDDGREYVGNILDIFLSIDNAGADLVAKTLYPLVGKTADTNFAETTKFLSKVSQTAEVNGAGMQKLAAKLAACDAQTRDQFVQVSAAVQQKAVARATQPGLPIRR